MKPPGLNELGHSRPGGRVILHDEHTLARGRGKNVHIFHLSWLHNYG
jgi:hypothetical protein